MCSTVCKWTYEARDSAGKDMGWSDSFFNQVGLSEFSTEGYSRLGTRVVPPGTRLGSLSSATARAIGLGEGHPPVPVGASLIDAHAGALGMLTVRGDGVGPDDVLGLICGTSTCHMALTKYSFD